MTQPVTRSCSSPLLRALRLADGARPPAAVVPDLSTSPKTKLAYSLSPSPPPATGPHVASVLNTLGPKKAQLLLLATQLAPFPDLIAKDVLVVATANELWFDLIGPDMKLGTRYSLKRGNLVCELAGTDLTFYFTKPFRERVAQLRGTPAAMQKIVNHLALWAAYDAEREREQAAKDHAKRTATSTGAPIVPAVRRAGLFGRKRSNPIHSWQHAETAACAWLRDMGFRDATLTARGKDAGIDVTSRKVVAQVKWEATAVGRPKLQQLHGAAVQAKKKGAFFSRSGYTADARTWAEGAGVAAFTLLDDGSLTPVTTAARKMLR